MDSLINMLNVRKVMLKQKQPGIVEYKLHDADAHTGTCLF